VRLEIQINVTIKQTQAISTSDERELPNECQILLWKDTNEVKIYEE